MTTISFMSLRQRENKATLLGPRKRGDVKEAFSWPFEQKYGNNGYHIDTKDIHINP